MSLPTPTGGLTAAPPARPLDWLSNPRVPRYAAAAIQALGFPDDLRRQGHAVLAALSDSEWKSLIAFSNHVAITLLLGSTCFDDMPAWVRSRMEQDITRNSERLRRLRSELERISRRLHDEGIEFAVLKGFSLGPEYTIDPRLRMHYDLDLFVPEPMVHSAWRAIRGLGYEPLEVNERLPEDHLPGLARKTGWEDRGDPFDPEIPPSVELHFRFWDAGTERLAAPGVEEFFARRVDEDGLPVLHPADRLAYSALHLVRHLFRSSMRVNHVYEIARFLETRAGDEAFWTSWQHLHPEPLRRLEAVAFRLAEVWFGCRLSPRAAEEVDRLPGDVPLWFEKYAASPVETLFHPNKHELWLHLALLDSARDRRKILLRKILPLTLPAGASMLVPEGQITFRMRWRQRMKYGAYLSARAVHHARALPVTIWHGLLWKWRAARLEAPFWWFALAGAMYALGFFVFYLLYNLFLLDRGYHEDALGFIAGALTLGGVAGVLPAAGIVRRLGLARALKISTLGASAAFALRCFDAGLPALTASAFIGGALSSLWAVCMAPAVAALTSERARPWGFSIVNSSGIGVGMLAGLLGGRVPGWFLGAHLAPDAVHSKQLTLFASVAFAALAFWPLSRLRLEGNGPEETHGYPRSPFVYRFLTAIGIWALAAGAFTPLFNAYFERRFHMALESIGIIFAFSHAGQVVTILLSPLILRMLGLTRGIASMQLATAVTLALLAAGSSPWLAAAFYVAFMSFQYMCDPGTNTLLMNHVDPGQRSGAAALSFLVIFLAQAVAAPLAGSAVARYGYPPMLLTATLLAAIAAFLFWRLPEERQDR